MKIKSILAAALIATAGLIAQAQPSPDEQLENAIPLNDAKAVRAAIKAGANPNRRVWAGHLLGVAATNGYTNSVRAMVDNGAQVNNASSGGWTALMGAADNGHIDIVKYLVSKKADINAKTNMGRSALMRSSYHGQTAVVQFLLASGAKVNEADSNGATALMLAAQQGHDKTVKVLLDAGADKAAKNAAQKSALDLALAKQAELDSYKVDSKGHTKAIALLQGETKKALGPAIGKVFSANGNKLVITGKGIREIKRGNKLKIKTASGEISAVVKETLHSKVKATASKAGAAEGDAVYLDK